MKTVSGQKTICGMSNPFDKRCVFVSPFPFGPREIKHLCPCPFEYSDGTFFLYFVAEESKPASTGIACAIWNRQESAWLREDGFCLTPDREGGEVRLLSPNIVMAEPGLWRMYFQVVREDGVKRLETALSPDGLNWTRESVVSIQSEKAHMGTPCAISLDNGLTRLYYNSNDRRRPGQHCSQTINVSESKDGLFFPRPQVCLKQTGIDDSYALYGPSVHPFQNHMVMWFAAWSSPTEGWVYCAHSKDGINWTREQNMRIPSDCAGLAGMSIISEPAFMTHGGRFFLFLEGTDEAGIWKLIYSKFGQSIQSGN